MALRNDDFRSLLQKGSSGGGPGSEPATDRGPTGEAGNVPKKKKERVWVKKPKQEGSDKPQEEKDNSARYRDRALERRKNVTSDVADVDEAAAQNLDADMTKYLGGDEAHTHLVKGLDLALLRKTREDMEKSQRIAAQMLSGYGLDVRTSLEGSGGHTGPIIRSQLAKDVYALVKQHAADFHAKQQQEAETKPVSTRSWLKLSGNEKFLPGRMLYQYDLSVNGPELPKTILVPKEDCPHADDTVNYRLDDGLMAKLVSSLRVQAQRRKHKAHNDAFHDNVVVSPRETEPVPAVSTVDDGSDLDMFGDDSDDDKPKAKLFRQGASSPSFPAPADVSIDESEAFDPVPARFREKLATSTGLRDEDGNAVVEKPVLKSQSVGAVLAAPPMSGSALDDLLSDGEEAGGEKKASAPSIVRKQVRVTSAKTLEAIKQRLKKKLDAPDEGAEDEFEASHSIAVVETDEEADDREMDRDKWLVKQKALEMKETLAATAAVTKKLDKEKQRRLKDAANLGVGGLAPLSAEEKAGATVNPDAAKQAAKKLAEKEKRKLDTNLKKIDKLIEQRKEKRSRGEDVRDPLG